MQSGVEDIPLQGGYIAPEETNNAYEDRLMDFAKIAVFHDLPDDYTFLEDAYYGSGGFKDGSYLIPHSRELWMRYHRRKLLSYYCNYVKPCVNGHVDPIFKDLPTREYLRDPFFDAYLKDVDGGKNSFNAFMKKAAKRAKLMGMALIVVDNVAKPEPYEQKALEQRRFPYAYIVDPKNIDDYAMDRYGNLSLITYRESYIDIQDKTKCSRNVRWTWTREYWEKREGGITTEGVNTIRKVPAVPLFGAAVKDKELKPLSEFYSIARTNFALYNACSEMRELLRNQGFSIMVYPVSEGDEYSRAKEVVSGTSDVLMYCGGSGGKPDYITPSPAPAEKLSQEIAMMVQEIYRMASLTSVTGVQAKTSGEAKAWDFQNTNQTISDFAKNIEEAERKIVHLFELYIKKDLRYTVKYSDDFGIVDTSGRLDEVTKALNLGVGGRFNSEAMKLAARALFRDQDDEILNAVNEDIERTASDEAHTKAEGLSEDV